MLLMADEFGEKRRRFGWAHRSWRESRIRRQPDKAELGEGASGPSIFRFRAKPTMSSSMELMIGPNERDEHVGIQERHPHSASSESNLCARSPGIIGASASTGKTGKPFFRTVADPSCKADRIRRESTWPGFWQVDRAQRL